VLVPAVLLLLLCGRATAFSLDGVWPDPNTLSGPAPIAVDLQSSDPFTPADAGLGARRVVHALLYLPPGASPSRPVPAIVLLHGSVGNYAERGFRYGLPLASLGVAVLVAETYASRPDLGRSFIGRALHITETMYDADAYAALDLLSRRPDIDRAHIGLIGFSYGGMATMYAMQRTLADRLARPGERFAAFVSYYGPCIARFDDVRTTGAPLLMMYGGRDELIHPNRCDAVASDLRRGGSSVDIRVFPDAVHQWDGEMAPRLIGRHLADCDFRVDPHGIVHDRNTGIVMTGPLTRGIILGLCTGSRPWPIGRDNAVVARSDAALGEFLKARGFKR
jgi:dienelactone hydrolase